MLYVIYKLYRGHLNSVHVIMGYMGKDDQKISLAMSYEEVQMNASWVHSQTTWIFVRIKNWKRGNVSLWNTSQIHAGHKYWHP